MAVQPMILLATAALLLAGAPSRARTLAVVQPWIEAADDQPVPPLGTTVGELEGATLYGETGEAVGEIAAVLADRDGRIAGLAVELGGFLGLGGKEVVLRFDQVRRVGDRIVTWLSPAQLAAQPGRED